MVIFRRTKQAWWLKLSGGRAGPCLVALGAPRQIMIDRYLESQGSGAMGVGEVSTSLGKVRRAPAWVRHLHLECSPAWQSLRWRRQLILHVSPVVLRKYKL